MKNSSSSKNAKEEAIVKALRENLRKRKTQKINRKEEKEQIIPPLSVTKNKEN